MTAAPSFWKCEASRKGKSAVGLYGYGYVVWTRSNENTRRNEEEIALHVSEGVCKGLAVFLSLG